MAFNWPTPELTVSEKIGIGTDTPLTELEVIGSISATELDVIESISATNLTLNGNLQLGPLSVKEFSNDGNLADNSSLAIPTEQAVKTYVDAQINQVNNALNTKAFRNGAVDQDFNTQNLSVRGNVQVSGNVEVATNLSVIGQLLGAAQNTSGESLRICCGQTPADSTDWQPYTGSIEGIQVDVDTSACNFESTLIYIVNLHGNSRNWETTGGSSPYPTPEVSWNQGFRIYVRFDKGKTPLTPESANSRNWHIQWIAIGK
ncbi:MAG: hypothetical protein AB4057_05855 [Crocosphaera sp.]